MATQLFDIGFAPFPPWMDAEYAIRLHSKEIPVKKFYNASLAWMEVADAVYVISGKGKGGGVDKEIKRAEELGIPVFERLMKLMAWMDEEETKKPCAGGDFPYGGQGYNYY